MLMQRFLMAFGTALSLVFAGCGDDAKTTETPPDPEGTLRVAITTTGTDVTAICYDLKVRDGANARVLDEPRVCRQASEGLGLSRDTVCNAASGRSNHSVTLNIVGVWLDGETAYDPTATDAGDLAMVTNPCPNGCTVQVSCTKDVVREASLNLTVASQARQGFFDLQIQPTVPGTARPAALVAGLPFLCYRVTLDDGRNASMFDRVLCAWHYGDGQALTYILPCNAKTDAAVHRLAVSVSGIFQAPPDVEIATDPGPGDRAAYAVTCADDCVQTPTCIQNEDHTVTFAPAIARQYLAGTVTVDIRNTLTGDGAANVAGGCYSIDVENFEGEALIGQPGICSEFNALPEGGSADVRFTGPCDGTPYDDGEDATTRAHAVTVRLVSLYDAANEPMSSNDLPAATLEGWVNPCPESGCVDTFECVEGDATDILFELETVVPAQGG